MKNVKSEQKPETQAPVKKPKKAQGGGPVVRQGGTTTGALDLP